MAVDLETWVDLSQIAGVVGGLIALIFVGLQIRDNSRAARAATAQAVHETYSSWYNSLLDATQVMSRPPDPRAKAFGVVPAMHVAE